MIDPVEHLARDDKWQLGAGDGTLFAPASPRWLDRPGFWDGATIHHYDFSPLFSVALFNEAGEELSCQLQSRRWTPAELTVTYTLGAGLTATEVRTVHPGGVFVSEWRLQAFEPTTLHLVAWTAQPASEVAVGSAQWAGALSFARTLRGSDGAQLRTQVELACLGETTSWGTVRAEDAPSTPSWSSSPFVEHWARGLPSRVQGEVEGPGTFHAAVHRRVRVEYQGASAVFAMRIAANDEQLRDAEPPRPVRPSHGTIAGASRRRWHAWYDKVPRVRCSDPYLETAYLYRWYVMHLNTLGAAGATRGVAEGPGERHLPTADGAAAVVRELRWLGEASPAREHLRTILGAARADGALRARVTADGRGAETSAGPGVGAAWAAVAAFWPDADFARAHGEALRRHAEWLVAHRDADNSGLLDLATADEVRGADVKDVRASAEAYALFRVLESLDDDASAQKRWRKRAERTREAIAGRLWDAEAGLYHDLGADGVRTMVATAAGFAPGAAGLVAASDIDGMVRVLTDPQTFGTSFPVPSLAMSDSRFSAEGEWQGRRRIAPTNGRTWPADTAMVLDALVCWSNERPALRRAVGDLLKRYVRMMFHDGDLRRPNAAEHYNPLTGRASSWRGIDDVITAPLADYVLSIAAGIRPEATHVVIDPFPMGLEQLTVSGVRIRQRALEVRIVGDRFTVISGGERHESALGQPVTLDG